MDFEVILSPEAEQQRDLVFKSYPLSDRRKLLRILTEDLVSHPRTGIGKPEKLKHSDEWSRKLNKKDRIVYTIDDNIVHVNVIQCIGHYDDK